MKRVRLSISTKILRLFLAGFASIAVLTSAIEYREIRGEAYEETRTSAQNIAQLLEDILMEEPALAGSPALTRAIQRVAGKLPDVVTIRIISPALRVVSSSNPLFAGRATSDEGLAQLMGTAGQRNYFFERGGERFLRVNRSLVGRYDRGRKSNIIGVVSIDMSISRVDAAVRRRLNRQIGYIFLLLTAVGGMVYAVARRTLVKPLIRIARATAQFGVHGAVAPLAVRTGDELEVLASTLNVAVAERDASEKALEAARSLADAANQAKGEFLANMSHEIRTPMNGVIGMVDLVLDTPLAPRQREYLQIAKDSAESLLTIVNEVLDWSRINSGKITPESIPFGLRESVGDAVVALAQRAFHKGIDLTLQVAPDVPDGLVGDPGRLRQILVNLVGNAIKFTATGEVIVKIGCEHVDDGEVELRFSVQDTGMGIDRAKQTLIFEAFSQADTSTTREFGGTGLGLSIATQLVQAMGGRIWVESEVGAGSTFHFTARFPIDQAAGDNADTVKPTDSANNESERPRERPADAGVSARALRILVVEDNAVNQKLAVSFLESRGHSTRVAADGQQAVDCVASERFDLVLMDVQMPVMGGLEATSLIRAREAVEGGHIPIVAMTARAMEGDREACLSAGMDAFVSKPVRRETLFAAIARAVGEEAPTPLSGGALVAKAQDPTFDLSRLREITGENAELMREVATLFMEEGPKRLLDIREAIRSGSASDAHFAAHTLKGAAGSITAAGVAEAAAQLEAFAAGGTLEGVQPLFDALEAHLAQAERDIGQFLAKYGPLAAE